MYRLEKTSTSDIGPHRATALLRLNTFQGQRPISRQHVTRLVTAMKAGTFSKGSIALARNGSDEPQVVMNGQHTLVAIVESEKTVRVTVDEYVVDDPLDFARLFGTFDVHRARSYGQIVHAGRHLFTNEALRELPLDFLRVYGTAIVYAETNPPKMFKIPDATGRLMLLEKHAEEAVQVQLLMTGYIRPRVGMTTAIVATHRVNPTKANGFWPSILNSTELVKHTPQWHLNKYLNAGSSIGGYPRQFQECATCICWWNAYATGKDRKMTKASAMNEIPKVLA